MNTEKQVQILDEAVCVLYVNANGKGMNLSLLLHL